MKDLYRVIVFTGIDNSLDHSTSEFIERWHYSKSARSLKQKYVFHLIDLSGRLVGVAVYGQPISINSSASALELRRFCLIDETPRNSESFFLAKTLQWLRKNQSKYDHVLTFADPNQGHMGTIYKAANFKYDGLEKNNPRIVKFKDGRVAHLRQYYDKKNGAYSEQTIRLQEAVSRGDAMIVPQERKHRFIYEL